MARQERLSTRKMEFEPLWETFVTTIQKGDLAPMFFDACEFPAVSTMLVEDDAHTTVTEERLLVRKEAILADIAQYQTRIKSELVKLYMSQPTNGGTGHQNATAGSEGEEVDLSILHRATTLFKCFSWTCDTFLPYPAIFEHEHVKQYRCASSILDRLKSEASVRPTAILLLKHLGFPEDTLATDLDDLNGRLACLCGHPDYQKPVDFGAMVSSQIPVETIIFRNL